MLKTIILQPLYILYIWTLELRFFIKQPSLLLFSIQAWFFQWLYTHSKQYQKDIAQCTINPIELTYGETPFYSINKAISPLSLSPHSLFLELGCATGKLMYFIKKKYAIQTRGVEILPGYNPWFKKKKLNAETTSFLSTHWEKATLIYITDTCLTIETLSKVKEKISTCKKNTLIFTNTNPLNHPECELIKKIKVPFYWGHGHLYIQKKIS